jgi:hypothetical protein
VGGDYNNTFVTERADLIVSANRDFNVTTQRQALHHLGIFFFLVFLKNTIREKGENVICLLLIWKKIVRIAFSKKEIWSNGT